MQTAKGIFTTIKVSNGIPIFLERHLMRLGMKDIKYVIKKNIKELLDTNNLSDAAINICVFENGEIRYKIRSLPQSSIISAVTIRSNKKLPTVKQLDRNIYKKAQKTAEKAGAKEAIFVNKNNLVETTIANLICQEESGDLITPKLFSQGLKGITRQLLLDKKYLTEKNISVKTNGPLIAINCLRIIGIKKLDNVTLVNPEPLMKKVQAILKKEEEAYENSYYR